MKFFKRVSASLTAFAMMASLSAVSLDSQSAQSFGSLVRAAEETADADYVLSVSREHYTLDSLKTFGEWTKYDEKNLPAEWENVYRADNDSKKLTEDCMDNKVATVKLRIDKNIGINIAQFILIPDPDLIFAGCVFDGNGNLSPVKDVKNTQLRIAAKYDKMIFTYTDKVDMTETGDFLTMLFILPDEIEEGRQYKIEISSDTEDQITSWNPQGSVTYDGSGYGYIQVGGSSAETTTASEPVTQPEETTTVTETTTEILTSVSALPETTTTVTTTTPEETTTTIATTTQAETTTTIATTTLSATTTTIMVTPPGETTTTIATTTPEETTTTIATTTPEETTTTIATTTPEETTTTVTTTTPAETTTTITTTTPVETTTPKPTETTKPLIDLILDSDKSDLKSEQYDSDRIQLEDSASIDVEIPKKMIYKGTESVEISVKLSDFDPSKEYFEYAGFGLELPDGFTIVKDSVKTDLKSNIEYFSADSLEAFAISSKTGYDPNGGFVIFRGVDTRNLSSNAEVFSFTLNISNSSEKFVNDISVGSVLGRISDKTVINDDGTIVPYISIINNGSGDKLYTETASEILMGLKGDVNLDHKVTQLDATTMLKELLSVDTSGKSVLTDLINKEEAGESALELAYFLGDVDESHGTEFTQIDATNLLKAILAADVAGKDEITDDIWNGILNK